MYTRIELVMNQISSQVVRFSINETLPSYVCTAVSIPVAPFPSTGSPLCETRKRHHDIKYSFRREAKISKDFLSVASLTAPSETVYVQLFSNRAEFEPIRAMYKARLCSLH